MVKARTRNSHATSCQETPRDIVVLPPHIDEENSMTMVEASCSLIFTALHTNGRKERDRWACETVEMIVSRCGLSRMRLFQIRNDSGHLSSIQHNSFLLTQNEANWMEMFYPLHTITLTVTHVMIRDKTCILEFLRHEFFT